MALEQYEKLKKEAGHFDLYTCPSGFVISEDYPFLGASPDSVVYDPLSSNSFGLAEVKRPFSFRNMPPEEACTHSTFFCVLDQTTNTPKLKRTYPYYCKLGCGLHEACFTLPTGCHGVALLPTVALPSASGEISIKTKIQSLFFYLMGFL